jgi:magnesium-transporting ATPase (P-type)
MVRHVAQRAPTPETVLEYPNRDKASSKVVKWIVVALLLASAALVAIVSVGGWDALRNAKALQVAYAVLYVVIAFFVARWRNGMLPVSAALALILILFAAVAAPQWFNRGGVGFAETALPEPLLGLITFVIIGVQIALIAFAMVGFRQNWQVEIERRVDDGRGGTMARAA